MIANDEVMAKIANTFPDPKNEWRMFLEREWHEWLIRKEKLRKGTEHLNVLWVGSIGILVFMIIYGVIF